MDLKKREIHPDEISELKTKLQAILFSISDGIVMTDFDGNILIINDSAKTMLGIRKKFPYEKKFLDYVEDKAVKAALSAVIDSPESSASAEVKVPKEHGETILQAIKSPVTTAQSEVLGRVIALRDITLEKQIETLKEDFVHSITHDLKSPLTSIQGYIDLFLGGEAEPLTPEQKRHIEIMDYSTKKLLKLINNILDMAKIDSGMMELSLKPWDATAGVYHILDAMQAIVKSNQ